MLQFKHLNLILTAVLILLFASCKKQNSKTGSKRVKEGTTIEVGLVFPEIRTIKNDTIKLALYPHARFFFIDLGLKNSEEYINLITKANKADVPVRVRVYENNQAEVAEIIPASNEDIKKYRTN